MFLLENNIFFKNQNGFIKNIGINVALAYISNDKCDKLDKSKRVIVVFLDLFSTLRIITSTE